ncbi:MAG: Crp/Fnr family transcriptional regulator [Eubacteriales bacterium]
MVDFLLHTALFAGCLFETAEYALHSPGAKRAVYQKGDRVFYEQGGALGVLLSGKVCVGGRRDRHKLVLNEMYPGVVFGFSSLFEGERHFETDICACRKSEVLWLEEALIEELLGLERRVGRNIIALQAEKIRFLNEKVLSFSSSDNEKKLLLYLEALPASEEGRREVPLGMSALSARLSMGRASLYRAFDRLEEENMIRREGRAVYILLPEKPDQETFTSENTPAK